MKTTAPDRFAVKAVAAATALILAMTVQALPLSYLIELERAKIEPAAKLFQQECGDHTDSQVCKEQRDTLVKVLNGLVSMVRKELALLDANTGDAHCGRNAPLNWVVWEDKRSARLGAEPDSPDSGALAVSVNIWAMRKR